MTNLTVRIYIRKNETTVRGKTGTGDLRPAIVQISQTTEIPSHRDLPRLR